MVRFHFVTMRQSQIGHAKKLYAVAGPRQQRHDFFEFWNGLAGQQQRWMRKLNRQITLGHTTFGHVHGHPVVRQSGPSQHQLSGLKRADPVADKHLARRGGDQMQFVFVMAVPTGQRGRKPASTETVWPLQV